MHSSVACTYLRAKRYLMGDPDAGNLLALDRCHHIMKGRMPEWQWLAAYAAISEAFGADRDRVAGTLLEARKLTRTATTQAPRPRPAQCPQLDP